MLTPVPAFLEACRQLIAIPSISAYDARIDTSNLEIIQRLADWLRQLNFTVTIEAVPDTRQKYNLLAQRGQGDGGLLLAGHTDTVPFDQARWRFDPFTLTEADNRLYGLGTADMKSFFAFIVDALRDWDQHNFKRPLYIVATADEETSMAGARFFAANSTLKPAYAIVGEPTAMQPIYAHKGHIANVVRIQGQSGHSSDPERGINAIEVMQLVIQHLMQLRDKLKRCYHNADFALPWPTLNLGHIHGGDAVNRICACCELHLDIRPLPGMTLDTLTELIEDALAPISMRWPGRLTIQPLHPPFPGYACDDQTFIQQVETLSHATARTVNYCSEAPFINQLCPTLLFGPGSIEQAHQPDEYLTLSSIAPTRQLMQQLIHHFCCQ